MHRAKPGSKTSPADVRATFRGMWCRVFFSSCSTGLRPFRRRAFVRVDRAIYTRLIALVGYRLLLSGLLGLMVTLLLSIFFGHKLAVFGFAVLATALVIHVLTGVHPDQRLGLRIGDLLIGGMSGCTCAIFVGMFSGLRVIVLGGGSILSHGQADSECRRKNCYVQGL